MSIFLPTGLHSCKRHSDQLQFVWLKVISMKEEAEFCYSELSFLISFLHLHHLKVKHYSGWSRIALLKWPPLTETTFFIKSPPSAPSSLPRTTVQVEKVKLLENPRWLRWTCCSEGRLSIHSHRSRLLGIWHMRAVRPGGCFRFEPNVIIANFVLCICKSYWK